MLFEDAAAAASAAATFFLASSSSSFSRAHFSSLSETNLSMLLDASISACAHSFSALKEARTRSACCNSAAFSASSVSLICFESEFNFSSTSAASSKSSFRMASSCCFCNSDLRLRCWVAFVAEDNLLLLASIFNRCAFSHDRRRMRTYDSAASTTLSTSSATSKYKATLCIPKFCKIKSWSCELKIIGDPGLIGIIASGESSKVGVVTREYTGVNGSDVDSLVCKEPLSPPLPPPPPPP